MITIYFLCFLLILFVILWIQDKIMLKKSQSPLSKDILENYFFKELIKITKEVKSIQGDSEVRLFIQNNKKEESLTNKLFLLQNQKSNAPNWGIFFGIIGCLITNEYAIKNIKIDGIIRIQNTWEIYLFQQFKNNNFSKEKIKKIKKEISNKINFLLNSKMLIQTQQKDIKKAWEIVLKNKILTPKNLNCLWGHVVNILFQDINKFKESIKK